MEYRLAKESDLDSLSKLFHEYRSTSISLQNLAELADSQAWIKARYDHQDAVFILAIEDKKLEAFITLYQGFSSVSLQKYWILNDLYVRMSARGKGCAKELMVFAHDYAVTTGAKGIELETGEHNMIAQNLYSALGYEENTHYKHYFWHAQRPEIDEDTED